MNLKLVFRSLAGNYKLMLLVFTGLVIGITSSILIYTKISYELSFDSFHTQGKNTYRVVRVTSGLDYLDGGLEYRTGVFFPLPGEIKKTIPEVQNVAAMYYQYGGSILLPNNDTVEAKKFDFDRGIVFTEASFFEIFDFGKKGIRWLEGEGSQVLQTPFVAVLTEGTANRLFPQSNPVGKEIILNGQMYTIGGIVEDFPQNTDFPFQIILSLSTFTEKMYPGSVADWGSLTDSYQCYVVLNNKSDLMTVERKFKSLYAAHTNDNEAEWRLFKLQSLNQVHKESKYGNYNNHTISSGLILGITMIGVFIFLIACFNYSNFFLADTLKKEKQIAVRLIMGGRPFNLFIQLFSESLIIISFALLVGLLISYSLIKTFYEFIDIPQNYFPDFNSRMFLLLLTLLLTGGFVSVMFSAFQLRFKPILTSLKEHITRHSGRVIFLRKSSIVLQFIVAQVVIISTLFIVKQIHFINNRELGYDTENIIVVSLPGDSQNKEGVLTEELLSVPGVEAVSLSSVTPAEAHSWAGLGIIQNGEWRNIDAEIKFTDSTYLDLFSMKILAGLDFSGNDTSSYAIVNREFVSEAGFENMDDAIGTYVASGDAQLQIKGVVEDFHSGSLHESIRPCIFYNYASRFNILNIKLAGTICSNQQSFQEIIDRIDEKWQAVFANEIFEYSFFTDIISDYYKSEYKAFNLFVLLASITVFLCVLGILGLSLTMNEQRTKEIGIRKVNGARISEVMMMLNKDFVKWVGIAFVIATPVAYYAMHKWLQNFAYKTNLSWWIFAFAGALALGIAILTVSWQSYRAATRNPVEALRYE